MPGTLLLFDLSPAASVLLPSLLSRLLPVKNCTDDYSQLPFTLSDGALVASKRAPPGSPHAIQEQYHVQLLPRPVCRMVLEMGQVRHSTHSMRMPARDTMLHMDSSAGDSMNKPVQCRIVRCREVGRSRGHEPEPRRLLDHARTQSIASFSARNSADCLLSTMPG